MLFNTAYLKFLCTLFPLTAPMILQVHHSPWYEMTMQQRVFADGLGTKQIYL